MLRTILIPLLPLLGFVINGLGFRRLPKNIAGAVGIAAVAASFGLVLVEWFAFSGTAKIVTVFDWISVGDMNIALRFQLDQLSLIMMLIITGIGTLIHLYSAGYMAHDEGFGKFFAFLNLFIFFMLLLVMGSNYLVMFIGWEGVGLCSYLLIGFWNKNIAYGVASRKAFIMNRIGDLGYLVGIFLILFQFGSVEYSEVFEKAANLQIGNATIVAITLCLFVGAMGKSAQIPLFTWLPDAMAGPTPVSALIHAATMVTAGIYMIVRSNVLYSLAPFTMEVISWVALATALMAAAIGLFQNDIKKVLAYSTVSQLGYMFLGLGVGAYSAGFFHVLTHAFFKALLFLAAGSVIHAMSDEQDIRKMGGLRKKLPITFITFLLGTIAISGIPPFAGFFSKDEILAHLYQHNPLMWGLAVVGSLMTSFYMFRLLFLTFFGDFRGTKHQADHLHESPLSMTLPLMILAGLSVVGGFLNVPEVLGGTAKLTTFLAPIAAATHLHLSHSTEITLMVLSVAGALFAAAFAYFRYVSKAVVPNSEATGIEGLIINKFYVDELYDTLFVKPIAATSRFFHKVIDELVVDTLGVESVGKFVRGLSSEFRLIQTGAISTYVFAMVMGITAVLVYALRSLIFG